MLANRYVLVVQVKSNREKKMQNKQRHGCLTAWLIYLLFAYFISAVVYFFPTNEIIENSQIINSENERLILGSFAILGIGFTFMIFKWVKLGFWGILGMSLCLAVVHVIFGQGIVASFFVIFCVAILFALLQIKKG